MESDKLQQFKLVSFKTWEFISVSSINRTKKVNDNTFTDKKFELKSVSFSLGSDKLDSHMLLPKARPKRIKVQKKIEFQTNQMLGWAFISKVYPIQIVFHFPECLTFNFK